MAINRAKLFGDITERLSTLSTAINLSGQLNVLNLHSHAEDFYQHFFKKLYDWDLKNLNTGKTNTEAIDLVCEQHKIVIQVSSTSSKEKIESALNKKILENYNGYSFKFISISKDASDLRKKSYKNPYNILFEPLNDIYDTASILKHIKTLDIKTQEDVFNFIQSELGQITSNTKLDSNLTKIIEILSKEDLNQNDNPITVNSFEIERKISFNNLTSAKHIVNDYTVNHNRLEKLYSEFDESGANKSNSVLAAIRKEYLANLNTKKDDELFFLIINNLQQKIKNSPNFFEITEEELNVCVNIIVVDSFIRCKIFENPSDYKYATT